MPLCASPMFALARRLEERGDVVPLCSGFEKFLEVWRVDADCFPKEEPAIRQRLEASSAELPSAVRWPHHERIRAHHESWVVRK